MSKLSAIRDWQGVILQSVAIFGVVSAVATSIWFSLGPRPIDISIDEVSLRQALAAEPMDWDVVDQEVVVAMTYAPDSMREELFRELGLGVPTVATSVTRMGIRNNTDRTDTLTLTFSLTESRLALAGIQPILVPYSNCPIDIYAFVPRHHRLSERVTSLTVPALPDCVVEIQVLGPVRVALSVLRDGESVPVQPARRIYGRGSLVAYSVFANRPWSFMVIAGLFAIVAIVGGLAGFRVAKRTSDPALTLVDVQTPPAPPKVAPAPPVA